ncbi:MAG: PIG-L family deacetylase [Chromatiales bacterium]|nr:PIG-L family deacetylase [Chromatiales bacterium]
MYGSTILILIPHPDDEVVGAFAAIRRARAQGSRVLAAYLTTGVPAAQALWPWQRRRHGLRVQTRRAEASAVAWQLGLESVLVQLYPTRSLRTHLATTLVALRELVVVEEVDHLWVPAYEGGHQDHDAASFLASHFRQQVAVYEFSEYHFATGTIRCNCFIEPANSEVPRTKPSNIELCLELTPAEREAKRLALQCYPSERGNLSYVSVHREVFRRQVRYDYTRAPHPGRTFYQRYQWVPKHPRVDYTTPESVCASFATFRDSALNP